MDNHRSHEFEPDCPACQREREQAIANRNAIRALYTLDYSEQMLKVAKS